MPFLRATPDFFPTQYLFFENTTTTESQPITTAVTRCTGFLSSCRCSRFIIGGRAPQHTNAGETPTNAAKCQNRAAPNEGFSRRPEMCLWRRRSRLRLRAYPCIGGMNRCTSARSRTSGMNHMLVREWQWSAVFRFDCKSVILGEQKPKYSTASSKRWMQRRSFCFLETGFSPKIITRSLSCPRAKIL